jgi:hypothetical protein
MQDTRHEGSQPALCTISDDLEEDHRDGTRTETRIFYMTAEGSNTIDHYDRPRDFREALRLASLFRAKALNENTEMHGALGYQGSVGRCSLSFRSLCRVRQDLLGQSCRWHELIELAERVSRVTGYWVIEHDPTTKTNCANSKAIPVKSEECWQLQQRVLDNYLSAWSPEAVGK